MICEKCGAEISSRYCCHCGYENSKERAHEAEAIQQTVIQDGMFGNQTLSQKNGVSATVKAGDWFKVFLFSWLLALIPIVGQIGSIIYWIWLLCKDTTAPSIKGYVKMNLIVSAVALVVVVLLVILLFAAVLPVLPSGASSFSPNFA